MCTPVTMGLRVLRDLCGVLSTNPNPALYDDYAGPVDDWEVSHMSSPQPLA